MLLLIWLVTLSLSLGMSSFISIRYGYDPPLNCRKFTTRSHRSLMYSIFSCMQFPLLSKSPKLQKLVTITTESNLDEVIVPDIPGGPTAFEICVKFCYGMTVTLNAYNVVMARCAAEYLEMHESVEKGNLIYKIEVFLTSSVFRSWKDSIIVLKSSKSLLPIPDDLKLITHCIESISSKVAVDTTKVDWSYTYNRKKLPEEERIDLSYDITRNRSVPLDWWVEDLCELDIDLYKRVIISISSKSAASSEVIGEALKAYVYRWLPGFSKGMIQAPETGKTLSIIDDIVRLLPSEKGSVSCSFLLKLLKSANVFELGEKVKSELVARIGQQLEEATVTDLLIRTPAGQVMNYDVEIVRQILLEFVLLEKKAETEDVNGYQIQDVPKAGGILSEASKLMVAKLIDSYLTEISKDQNLPLVKFLELAEMVSCFNRPSHDGLYRAIDTYLKVPLASRDLDLTCLLFLVMTTMFYGAGTSWDHEERKEEDMQANGLQETISRCKHARSAERAASIKSSSPSTLLRASQSRCVFRMQHAGHT